MTAVREAAAPVQAEFESRSLDLVRRLGSATALVLAPWGFVIANAGYTWATRDGGSDETGAGALALAGTYPTLFRIVLSAIMVGTLLLIPAVLAAMRLAHRSWLTFLGGSLMIAGYVCYLAVSASQFIIIRMAERGGPLAEYAALLDAGEADGSTSWVFLLFVAGNLGGTLLFAIGLLRSRVVPAWASVLIGLWPPLHITGLVVGNELVEVAGAILQAIGFAGVAAVVGRRRD